MILHTLINPNNTFMALNKEVFKTRSLTAVIFVAVMLVGLFWNYQSFIVLFTVIHFGCWYEFVKLMKKIHGEKFLPFCFFGLFYITLPILMMLNLAFKGDVYTNDKINEITNTVFYSPIIPCGI